MKKRIYDTHIKRGIDIVVSLIGIIVCAIPMVVVAVIIKLDSKGPVLFKQNRIGRHKEIFSMMKFRSMYVDKDMEDIPTHLLTNPEARITKVGKVLRSTSLDELPQLFNILKGDMSIIGPRPALWNQDDLVAERDIYGANNVRPGLTGWAQINGRDELEIDVKAMYDGEYVVRESLLFDIKCFFGTIASVLKHDGVVEGGTGKLNEIEENKLEEA